MRATGIVRRIDDLGRVVIPKEIRRTLRIREGDPLEIFVDREGMVILKKYSPIGEMGNVAQEYAEALHENTQHMVLVGDRDEIIAVAGAPEKKEYLNKQIGESVESCMDRRRVVTQKSDDRAEIVRGITEQYKSYIIVPILWGGDPIGSVMVLSKKSGTKMGDVELRLANTAASFLAKQMG